MNGIKPFKYFPHTDEDIAFMLKTIGISNIDELFNDIPNQLKIKDVNLNRSLSELELRKEIINISKKNKEYCCYCGGGSYDVYTPSIIDTICSRQEFLTSYTPYQAEISQGTLQYIFEFQSIICELTGLDVSNASMYDGATATAEACIMASNFTRRNKVLVSKTLNPNYLEVVETYCKYKGLIFEEVDVKDYAFDKEDLLRKIDSNTAGIVMAYPNYYGYLEDYKVINDIKAKDDKIQFILSCDISSLALLKTPKELNCDIACGDAQTLGISKSFGGPYIGYMACKETLMRKLPGRIVGMTYDNEGRRGYVLTLQAREQHIRREKANSNICSNQSLMALMVTVYSSLMGKNGLLETQQRCYQNSHYLKAQLLKLKDFHDVCNKEFLKEFVLQTSYNADLLKNELLKKGYLSGLNINNDLVIFCVTETKTKEDIDEFVKVIREIVGEENE